MISAKRLKELRKEWSASEPWDLSNCVDLMDTLSAASVGEKHYKAKLTLKQVKTIRSKKGYFSESQLAKRYGVSKSNINSILSGDTWKTALAAQSALVPEK